MCAKNPYIHLSTIYTDSNVKRSYKPKVISMLYDRVIVTLCLLALKVEPQLIRPATTTVPRLMALGLI